MQVVGRVDGLWRFPVKSMRGLPEPSLFLGYAGAYGDRIRAFRDDSRPAGFPYLTGREQRRLLLHAPRFRHPDRAAQPPNLHEAQAIGPGLTPAYGSDDDLALDVQTPDGDWLAVDDPRLAESLCQGLPDGRAPRPVRSQRALTDCRPVSLLSTRSVDRLGAEMGQALDARRFRANLLLDLLAPDPPGPGGFTEDGWIGRVLRIGERARLMVLERDQRCRMVSFDPDTAEEDPQVLRAIARHHDARMGVYAAVLAEGVVQAGDPVSLEG